MSAARNPVYYEVHDLFFATFCVARGLELRKVYRRPDGWVIFCFDNVARIRELMLEAERPTTQVGYQEWRASEKYVRGMMKSIA